VLHPPSHRSPWQCSAWRGGRSLVGFSKGLLNWSERLQQDNQRMAGWRKTSKMRNPGTSYILCYLGLQLRLPKWGAAPGSFGKIQVWPSGPFIHREPPGVEPKMIG
jgi:hypothetical protein